MADGSSGLSLSEMGISTVKKSAKVVQATANPFIQGVKQQVAGGSSPQQTQTSPSEAGQAAQRPQQSSAQPPNEGTVFDIFSQVKQQVAGSNANSSSSPTQQIFGQTKPQQKNPQGGTIFTPTQVPGKPNENASLSGSFDLNNAFNEKNPFVPQVKTPIAQQASVPQISEAEKAQRQSEEKQKLEVLRKQLFDAYKHEFIEKSEGKQGEKEETVQERQEREEREEEDKRSKQQQEDEKMEFRAPSRTSSKMPGLPGMQKAKSAFMNLLKPKQGSKEGRSGKG